LVLAAIVAGGAFAQSSAGGGIVYTGDYTAKITVPGAEIKYPWNAFGFYGFYNDKYIEASLGLLFGFSTMTSSYPGTSGDAEMEMSFLSLGVLGKYPFAIGEKIVLFPALGLDVYLGLSAKEKKSGDTYDDPGDFSHLWFRFGGGIDYNLTDKLYLRGLVLLGLRTAMQFERDLIDGLADSEKTIGFGPSIKVAVGYNF